MKSLTKYIIEKVKDLPKSVKGIIVFDIDDTLLKVKPNSLNVYKKVGDKEIKLSASDLANDPDASDPSKIGLFDYRDFRDDLKVYNSIIEGTPLIKNLRIMDGYVDAGYEFCFLTARSYEETIKKALDEFLLVWKRWCIKEVRKYF